MAGVSGTLTERRAIQGERSGDLQGFLLSIQLSADQQWVRKLPEDEERSVQTHQKYQGTAEDLALQHKRLPGKREVTSLILC